MYPENYEVPAAKTGYFKPKQGDNVLRIVNVPILGWVGWKTLDGKDKPFRFRMTEKPVDLRPFKKQEVNHFQAFLIWNYAEESLQIWEITQTTIMRALQNLYRDDDWGDFREYDIKINRKGESLDTEYAISPKPKKALPAEAARQVEETYVNLEALFYGKDPFNPEDVAPHVEDEIAFD